jgi:hypothetical protein
VSNRYRFNAASEPAAPSSADEVGQVLAAHPEWFAPFVVFLSGLNFHTLPSMGTGAHFFEAATEGDQDSSRLLGALDTVYADVRDGLEFSLARGAILEQFVRHALRPRFPLMLGACEVLADDEPESSFRLDASTGPVSPAVGVECKASETALKRSQGDARKRLSTKVGWVVGLIDATDGQLAAVFATWATEEKFRAALEQLLGRPRARFATVIAHEQLARLPDRLHNLRRRLEKQQESKPRDS